MCVASLCVYSIIALDNKVPADVLESLTRLDDLREVYAAAVTPYFYNVDKEVAPVSEV